MPLDPAVIAQRRPKGEHAYNLHGPEIYKRKAEQTMAFIDAMPLEWRLLVHDFGVARVRKLYLQRITARKALSQLVTIDLDGLL